MQLTPSVLTETRESLFDSVEARPSWKVLIFVDGFNESSTIPAYFVDDVLKDEDCPIGFLC